MTTDLRFTHRDFFILRAPFLPAKVWLEYRHNTAVGAADPAELLWTKRMGAARELFARAPVSEAIYLASGELHHRLQSSDWDSARADSRKLLLTFERYLNRMCLRSTPFGMFSTVAIGRITSDGYHGPAQLEGDGSGVRRARVDAGFLQILCDQMVIRHREQLPYLANRSAYVSGEFLKYTDWSSTSTGGRNYQLAQVDRHPVVEAILALCDAAPLLPQQVCRRVAGKFPQVPNAVLEVLIGDLIEARLLLPALTIDLLAPDPARALAAALLASPASAAGRALLRAADELDVLTDVQAFPMAQYQRIGAELAALCEPAPKAPQVRVDCFRPDAAFSLSRQYCDELLADLGLLISRFCEEEASFNNLAQAFSHRYGESVVPLTELLDDEELFGAGSDPYNCDLLRKFGLTKGSGHNGNAQDTLREFDKFLVGKLLAAPVGSNTVLRITPEEVRTFKRRGRKFPDSLFAIMTVLPPTAEGTRTWLQGISNSSLGAWTGRFAYGDPAIGNALRDMARTTEQNDPEVLHAEICYMPYGKLNNVMSRADIWPYRINLVEGDLRGSDNEIPLNDLLVTVVGGEVQLYSRRHGKRVIPHMSSAHNSEHFGNVKAYSLLRSLELHPAYFAHFGWSNFFRSYPYLPRLEYANIILAPARWLIQTGDFVPDKALSEQENRRAFATYLAQRGLPALTELKSSTTRCCWTAPMSWIWNSSIAYTGRAAGSCCAKSFRRQRPRTVRRC